MPEWKRSALDEKVILYIVQITKRDNESWTLEKRYSEFDELNKNLKKTYSSLPNMPGKSFFKISENAELEGRRTGLESFLRGLIVR